MHNCALVCSEAKNDINNNKRVAILLLSTELWFQDISSTYMQRNVLSILKKKLSSCILYSEEKKINFQQSPAFHNVNYLCVLALVQSMLFLVKLVTFQQYIIGIALGNILKQQKKARLIYFDVLHV